MDPYLLFGDAYAGDSGSGGGSFYGNSGEDLLGLGDYSGYAINEERDYDSGGFDLGRVLSGLGRGALNFASTPRGLLSILAALAAAKDRPRGTKPYGGGVSYGMAAPRQLQEVKNLGKYGDIQRYAAQGGLMQAYAQGGAVRPFPMQDGGFVMTKSQLRASISGQPSATSPT